MLISCIQINIKVSYMLISEFGVSKSSTRGGTIIHYSCMHMIKHSQSNKFEISLQYLKKKLGMEFIFCMQKNIKIVQVGIIVLEFRWKWLDMCKVPKIGYWQYFCNRKKRYCNCCCFLLWWKTNGYAQKWARPFRSKGLYNQVYLTYDLMNWVNWLNDFCMLIVTE